MVVQPVQLPERCNLAICARLQIAIQTDATSALLLLLLPLPGVGKSLDGDENNDGNICERRANKENKTSGREIVTGDENTESLAQERNEGWGAGRVV